MYIDFIVRTHHLDLLSKLLVYYLVYLLLRNGWHSIFRLQLLPIQRELRSFTPFSIITPIGGRQFLLDMLIISIVSAYFHITCFVESSLTACGLLLRIIVRTVFLVIILSLACTRKRSLYILACMCFESTSVDFILV